MLAFDWAIPEQEIYHSKFMPENSYFQFTKTGKPANVIWTVDRSVHTSASKCDKSEHYSMRARTSFYSKKYRQGNYISHTLLYVSFPYNSFFLFSFSFSFSFPFSFFYFLFLIIPSWFASQFGYHRSVYLQFPCKHTLWLMPLGIQDG